MLTTGPRAASSTKCAVIALARHREALGTKAMASRTKTFPRHDQASGTKAMHSNDLSFVTAKSQAPRRCMAMMHSIPRHHQALGTKMMHSKGGGQAGWHTSRRCLAIKNAEVY